MEKSGWVQPGPGLPPSIVSSFMCTAHNIILFSMFASYSLHSTQLQSALILCCLDSTRRNTLHSSQHTHTTFFFPSLFLSFICLVFFPLTSLYFQIFLDSSKIFLEIPNGLFNDPGSIIKEKHEPYRRIYVWHGMSFPAFVLLSYHVSFLLPI